MGRKKQEMSQVYQNSNNEFIFGEKGGRGKNLSSFLKNLSLTGSSSSHNKNSDEYNEVNSNIYGNLSYGTPKPNNSGSTVSSKKSPIQRQVSVGASYSHFTSTPSPDGNSKNNSRPSPYIHGDQSRVTSSGHIKPVRRSRSMTRYADLDDDWDADLDEVAADNEKFNANKNKFKEFSNRDSSSLSVNLQPSLMLDSLYPDLAITTSGNIPASTNSSASNKQSLDEHDYQVSAELTKLNQLNTKYQKFRKILTSGNSISIQELRKLSWNGIPSELRALTWQILLGYLPTNKSRQNSTLKMKRQAYLESLEAVGVDFDEISPNNDSSMSLSTNSSNSREKQLYHQIKIDVKRTNPTIKFYSYPEVQKSLRKVLYLWAVRHPASGYVQGINDLATPFFQIYLNNYIWQLQRKADEEEIFIPGLLDKDDEMEQKLLMDPKLSTYTLHNFNPGKLSARVLSIVEADTYWCLSKLLETITDNYIHQQPGIIRQVSELRNLISKTDIELINHFDSEGIEFIQFAFRWMNCLLMREMPMDLVIRMWDTYLSETPLGFNNFHVYVCAAYLIKFSSELKEKDFQEILLFLQNPPSFSWKEKDIELILSEAFIWQSLYKNASAHLR